jgi:hypothetical protein
LDKSLFSALFKDPSSPPRYGKSITFPHPLKYSSRIHDYSRYNTINTPGSLDISLPAMFFVWISDLQDSIYQQLIDR